MRLPTIAGVIRRRLLLNYRVEPDVLAHQIPAPFVPKLHHGSAIAGICLIRLEAIRPRGTSIMNGMARRISTLNRVPPNTRVQRTRSPRWRSGRGLGSLSFAFGLMLFVNGCGANETKESKSAEAKAPVEAPPASSIKIDDIAAPAPSVVPASVIERARSRRPFSMPEDLANYGFLYHVAIDAEGRVGEVRIAHSGPWKKLPPDADQIFRDVIRRTRFKPATLNDRPVPYHLIMTIRVADIQ